MLDAWVSGEGNNWWRRNKAALLNPARAEHDRVLAMLDCMPPLGMCDAVMDIGCANGWMLEQIRQRYGCDCDGIDLSEKAIEDGRKRYPQLGLYISPSDCLPNNGPYNLITFSFVLHWVDRASLAKTIAEVDRVLQPGGYIILADFLPDEPTKVRYHHRQDVELWTYKQDYAKCFTALGTYREIARHIYNHDTGAPGDCDPMQRAVCVLLRKEDTYACADRGGGRHRQ